VYALGVGASYFDIRFEPHRRGSTIPVTDHLGKSPHRHDLAKNNTLGKQLIGRFSNFRGV
jgi:hypothetical protein